MAVKLPMNVADVLAFSDGGCRGNPGGPGAWAFLLIDPATLRAREGAAALPETTNNRMELLAVIEALSAIRSGTKRVIVHSDSKYVINCATRWLGTWKKLGWRRREGPLKNVDLLMRLDALLAHRSIEFCWIPGHSGHRGNDRVDELANLMMDRLATGGPTTYERRFTWTGTLPKSPVERAQRVSAPK
jgi:ribonuclease HI